MTGKPSTIIVVHGGPGAPGSAHALAAGIQAISPRAKVLEPMQRGSAASGGKSLSVARHVADLHVFIHEQCGDDKPMLVGHSWGAMLILAYAAAHPDAVQSLTLIGCGTFDLPSRARYQQLLRERQPGGDGDDPFKAHHYDVTDSQDKVDFDEAAHNQTWTDMLRCQARGLYPASFAQYRGEVLMVHGDYDPHPGAMIRDSLLPHLPRLRYHPLKKCGHEPWRERQARDAFFEVLRGWLTTEAGAGARR
ncbi:MAG: alpha/beta fold hydrolase [Phycisphaerales bacterium]